jgi:LacI family transcriptional regulator
MDIETFSASTPAGDGTVTAPRGRRAGRRATMKEVARLAGVSLSTVSTVINAKRQVSPELEERVLEAARVLQYRRDLTASNLRRADRVSASIGLVFPDVSNPFFSAVHRGIEEVARQRGVFTLAGSSDEDPTREQHLIDAFSARSADGLVIAPTGADQSYLARAREEGIPIVFVDRAPRQFEADMVLSDNSGGIAVAVAQLLAIGHRQIGYIGDLAEIPTAAERLAGYREALSRHGMAEDPRLIRMNVHSSASAQQTVFDMVSIPDPPTALISAQNLITVGTVHALRTLGLQHRIAVIGFDDLVLADATEPALTVVAQNPLAIGHRACELLFARIDGEDGPPRRVTVPTSMIRRGSGEIGPRAGKSGQLSGDPAEVARHTG